MKKISFLIFLMMIITLGSCSERLYDFATTSPGKTYRVQLTETKTEVSPQNTLPYKTFFRLEKQGNMILGNEILYSGDDNDPRFATIAPEAEWISERTVRFGRMKITANRPYDWIEFHNNSSQPLTYAFISWTISNPNPNERFLLLDIKPDEKIRIQVTSQASGGADLSSISCLGRFEDGNNLTMTTRNFRIIGKYDSPSHYLITVSSDKTLIESQEHKPNK